MPESELLSKLRGGADLSAEEEGWSKQRPKRRLRIPVKLKICVSDSGTVERIGVQGDLSLDEKLAIDVRVRDWRFEPFVEHGEAIEVCSTLELLCLRIMRSTSCQPRRRR